VVGDGVGSYRRWIFGQRREDDMYRLLSRSFAMVAASVLIAMTLTLTASASTRSGETLFLTQRDDFTPVAWDAHGAFTDSGTWDRGVITFHGGAGTSKFAGTIQTFMTGAHGSFRMTFQGLGDGATGVFGGTWQIGDGIGAYAGVHGNGTWQEIDIPDPDNPGHLLFTFPCPGTIHLD
jgi:hypothetical protein